MPESDTHVLEKICGVQPKVEPHLTKEILPESPGLRQILKAAAELLGAPVEAGRVEALAEEVQGGVRSGRSSATAL